MSTEQAASVAATFSQAIAEMVKNPHSKPTELDLCSQHDLNILSGWNNDIPERLDSRVDEMIFHQGHQDPSHVAVSSWDGELTYGELDRLSSSLAAQLAKQGVGCGMFVPLCFEKTKWTVLAMLGVIKAGGAYVLLDPSYPSKRMESICQDVEATILLASSQTIKTVQKLTENVIVVDDTSPIWSCNDDCSHQVHSHDALYAAFTSGSTGRPKGIVVEHGSFCTRALANGALLKLNKYSRVLQFASYAFDVSHRDILFTLIHKGTVCIPSETDRINNLELFVNRHQVNWASLTPSVAALLEPEAVPTLQTLVLAGEAMSATHLSTWADKVQLMNAYGPSECIAVSCINPRLATGSDHTNIGRGVGSAIWIVNPADANRLAPIGAIGELVIETAAVSRGYLKDQEKTEASFPDHVRWRDDFQLSSQGRVYKTGDLGRFNVDGTISFMGRKDNQVKISGQRVELAEIEHHMLQALASSPEDAKTIQVVVDMVIPKESPRPTLAAFIYQMDNEQKSEAQRNTAIQQMTAHMVDQLAELLPAYMIPSVCIPVEMIPMTRSGKTDRRALRQLGASMTWDQMAALSASTPSYRAPATERERQLHRIFMAVLNLEADRVGADHSFVRLGGDSIDAMRLVAAAREEGLQLTVADVFRNPQLNELAQLAQTASEPEENIALPCSLLKPSSSSSDSRREAASLCGIQENHVEDVLPCTPLQEDLFALKMKKGGLYIRRFEFKIRPGIDVSQLMRSWEQTVAVVPLLRTRIVDLTGQGLVQVVVNEPVNWRSSHDSQTMGLETPLAKHEIVTERGQTYLVLTIHYAMYDEWSMALVLDTTQKIYRGQQHSLVPFAGFIKHIVRIDEDAATKFWRRQFLGLEVSEFPPLPLPHQPQPDRTLTHSIDVDWEGLDFTAGTMARAALAILVSRYTNCPDAVFGATVMGRQAAVPGLESMAGPTFTTLPIRVMVDEEQTVRRLLQQVNTQAIDMIPYEQMGLQHIHRINDESKEACRFQTLLLVQPAEDKVSQRSELFFLEEEEKAGDTRLEAFTSYALILRCELNKQGMRLRMTFDQGVLHERQVMRMTHHFGHVLQQICVSAAGNTPLRQIEMAGQQDLSDIWTWNGAPPREVDSVWDGVLPDHLDNPLIQLAGHIPWVIQEHSESRLAAVGCVGELWLEIPGDGEGHLYKSAASFIENPQWLLRGGPGHSGRSGCLYKTGKLAKCSSDGTVVVLGCKDTLSRINGRRVNLRDIEHHVRQVVCGVLRNSSVAVVAEIVTPQGSESPMLVALLCDSTDLLLTSSIANAIDEELSDRLQLKPHAYGILKDGSGQIDWNRLREQANCFTLANLTVVGRRDQDRARPQTEAECQLRDLWASVLDIPAGRIRLDDSFFRLGGDSITAMRLVGAARRHSVSLTVGEIFSYPQLKRLATMIKAAVAVDQEVPPFSLLNLPLNIDEKRSQTATLCGVEPSLVQDAFPCTPLQAGLLALTAQSPGDYITRKVFQLHETTDVNRLARAWAEVVATTPILRTRIVDLGSQGLVQVNVKEDFSWKTESDLDRYIRADSEEPMGLGTPLTRFGLVSCGMHKYCILTVHHAMYDDWLISLLLQATHKAYHGQPRLALTPFHTFIKAIYSVDKASTADFWKAQLDGLEGPIFPAVSAFSPRTDSYATHCIETLRVDSGDTTVSMAIRAAWAILSAQYMNAREALFGATVTGRQCSVPGIELVGGPTIATVPVRVAVDGESTVEQLLQQVQAQAVQMIPFEQGGLQWIRRVSADADQACHFQTLLVVQPMDPDHQQTQFVPAQRTAGLGSADPYALVLECKLLKQGVRVQANYDSRIIAKEQVERLLQQFDHVLRQVCAGHQATKVKNVQILSEADLHDIWKWNGSIPTAQGVCVHTLITDRTHKQREAPAIDSWDGRFTYGQLDELSTRLAHRLGLLGVGPEVFVPLLFEKSRWTPVAILGVIKAGGAFVLLEPNHPLTRLQDIYAEVNAHIVVSSPAQAAKAANLAMTVVSVGDGQDIGCDCGELTTRTTPENTLYAVFTSGSTGKPKGALLHHNGFATNALAYNYKLGLGSDVRILQFSSHAFDVCISDLLFTLIGGGCICIPSSSGDKDDPSGAIRQFNANLADLTPSVLRIMSPSDVPTLTTVMYGGEAASKADLLAWCDSVRLINVYGPAECSVIATMQPHITADSDPLNIGTALTGVCWVVNPADTNRLVPVGAVGELLLEGPLVGQGYINNADKTTEAFLNDPPWLVQGYSNHPGRRGRVYKTGDLVRYAADGTLQFVGRKDTQVKLRGQRIELGEVEHHVHQVLTTICRQEQFEEDATLEVVAEIIRPQETGRPSLVAFASISNNGLPVEENIAILNMMVAELDVQLAERLPAYMIPDTYFPLGRIPLGRTGKTDRRRLREIGCINHGNIASQRQGHRRTAPSTEMESILLELWMNVLNLPAESISVDSAWIRLGGDSITAMQLASRCRARNIRLTSSDVLRAQTIQRLARCCSLIQQDAAVLSVQTIEEEPWGLTPAQHLFFECHPDGLDHFNQSFLLRIKTLLSTDNIRAAIHALAERHPMLRARFQRSQDGDWQQYVASYRADVIAFAAHHVDRDAIASLAQSRQEQLDIQHGPVFAADVFCLPSDEQILLISAHHLVIDLVSWRVIWHDLEQSLLGRQDAAMRPKTSFQAWCKMQSQMAKSLMPSQVLPFVVDTRGYEYWGVDFAQNTEAESETHVISLDEDITTKLLGPSNERLRTEPTDIFLAMLFHSFQLVFADRPSPPIFVEGHGRDALDDVEVDLSEIVGWFTTIFPIYMSSRPNDTIVDMIKLAKDIRRSVPGKGLPYSTSRHLTPAGQAAFKEHHKVEVLFNYAGIYQQLEGDDSLLSRETDPVMTANFSHSSSATHRVGLVELNLGTQYGRLNISCSLHRQMKHQARLQRWIRVFADSLTQAVHELSTGPLSFTLSDFPLLSLSYSGLDSLEKTIQGAGMPLDAIEDIYPCTPTQEGILLSIQKETSSYMNHQVWLCEMNSDKAPVCPAQLEAAWRRVVHSHSILSTVFFPLPENGLFAQVLLANAPVRVNQIRCESWDPVDTLVERGKPVFADGEPLHQFTICQSSSGDVACRLDMNHALNDAESASIIANDLERAYDCVTPSATPRFSDLMQHLRRTPAADRMEYWRRVLMDVSPCRFPVQSISTGFLQGEHGYIPLAETATSRIHAFCVNRGITRSVFIQIAWAMVLSWYTGTSDVCFGYMASGRDFPIHNIENMAGPLANMLISRMDVGQPLDEAIGKTAESSIEHLAHQHVSLAQIQHELKLGREPLFKSCVTVRRTRDGVTTNQLRLQSAGGDDPHEDISSILTMAIGHILQDERVTNGMSGRFNHVHSLRADFFQSVVGANQQLATDFWQQYFANLDTQHFPSLPFPSYSPQASSTLSYCLQDFQWSHIEVAVSTAIRVAVAVLLARYTNTSDVVLGVLTKHSKLNLGTVPVRQVLDWEATLGQLLEHSQGQSITMEEFEQMGLHNIQRVSDKADQGCQFQTLLVEAACEDGHIPSGLDAFGLIFQYFCDDKGLQVQAKFDSNMIEEAHVERMLHQFEHVLRQLHNEHNQPVKAKDIPLACEEDMRNIWAWNQSVPESADACMHDKIAAMARKQPDALAICAWDGELTYGELDTLSTRLASHLMQHMDGNTTVPLCFEKSLWTTVAMIAVMKAGGACLALDTTQPEGRLATLVEQIRPRFILSSAANADMAGHISKVTVLVVDRAQLDTLETSGRLPVVQPSANLYIVFTSGSTGKPKGALISHANFASAALHQREVLQFGPGSRIFDAISYAFDMAWSNVLHTFALGGCLCIPEPGAAKDNLLGSLRQYRATHVVLTPTLARTIVPDDLPDLQCFISIGEALDDLVLLRWSKVPHILNAYGPAECSCISTIAELTSEVPNGNIGRGLGLNTWIVSLQNDNDLAPVYGVGELWLEGPLVGQGYLNQAQTTSEVFVDNPPWLIDGGRHGRLYKTGDLVKYHTDGSLIFIGRKDTQVKIRGQRVELAEVEHHVLQALSDRGDNETIHVIAEAIKPCDGSHPVLVAFVSRESRYQSSKTVREITSGLEEKLSKFLPAYMIPTAYIPIEQLPLTASGKTDRLKLQQHASALTREDLALLTAGEEERRAPRTERETVLQRLCAGVLGVSMDIIGLDVSFFRLGGDSIAAIKLVAMARQEGWNVTMGSIFSRPKLSDLALTMGVLQADADRPPPPYSLLPDGSADHVRGALHQLGIDDSAVEDVYPCTAIQEGLMAMTVQSSDAYVYQTAFTLPVNVDSDAFRAAWDATVAANAILRTRLIHTEAGMFQAVIRGSIEWETAKSMPDYLADDTHKRMGLGVPLLRLALFGQANMPLCFVLTIHHALYDGLSLRLILQQVQESYTGNTLQLQPFSPFVAYLSQVDKKAERDFWVSRFANLRAPTFPALPSATYTPGVRMSFTQSITLPPRVDSDFTLATLIRLAWAVVIAHHTDADDVVFGETLAGRNASFADVDRLTGPTITTIPIRVELRASQSVAEALDNLQKNMVAAIPYEQAGLQNIRHMSSETAAACEFQSHLGIQPLEEDSDESTLFRQHQSHNSSDQFSSYALVLVCSGSFNNQNIGVECTFDPSIVDEDETRKYVNLFQTILCQLCSNPEQKITDLQVITTADIAQLVEWNSDLPLARHETLHDLILNHCISQSDRRAISSWDGAVTYAELDALSRALALHLISTGVESNMIVPLCFQRSKWSVISILAVLRTGAACLLVDPTHPPNRIQDFVEQTGAVIAVVDPLQTALMQGMVPNVITVSSALIDDLGKWQTGRLPTVSPGNTAFIVFTSGSTGKPKGIMLEHVQLSTSIRDHGPGMGVNSNSRSLHFASYAFDASIYEICTTLVSGGCLCVMSEHDRMNDLTAFIRSKGVTWATLPNSATNILHPDDVPSLQTLVLGGEAVTQDVVEKWASRLTLINGYGPAEATICAACPIPAQGWKPGTFGNIVGGVGWIATPSDASKLAAIGAVGELLIEGPVLARGYLNNPEKTASSFIEDLPWMKDFRPAGKGRVYKSGDLVQYNPDGTFRFVGRKDTQVKLRGQRIELGEVEFRIRQCLPAAHNVVAEVIIPSGPNANSLLVAFVHLTMTNDDSNNLFLSPTEELRAIFFAARTKLRGMVPGYMVPGLFIPLGHIPRTTSGKVDRRQLRDRASSLPRTEFDLFISTRGRREKPYTEMEERLRDILSSVTDLSIDEIGVKDNIFHLGADSITIIKMVTAARKQDISISVAEIFSHPTIYDLAAFYNSHNPQHQAVSSVVPGSIFGFINQRSFIESIDCTDLPFNTLDIYDALPALQGQEERLLRRNYYFMLDFDRPIDCDRLEKACRGLFQRHTIFRTVFIPYQDRVVQVVLRSFNAPIEIVRSDDCLVRFTESLCQKDSGEAQMPGDLITRMTLVQGSDHRATLILRLSHAQYDGMSMPVIWKDLTDLYQGRQLPDSIEYSAHVRQWLAAGTSRAYEFWRNLLDASTMTYIEDKHLAEKDASISSPIFVDFTIALPDPPHGITMATLIKAAWSLVLTQLTGDRDVVFGQGTSGRSSSNFDAENLVGLCFNDIPVRVKYNPHWTILDLLHHVQNQHGDSLPFESVELRDIVSRSTPWPQSTYFGTIVTHQNIDVKPFPVGGTQPSMRLFHQEKPHAEVLISTFPRGQTLLIELAASNQTLGEPHAQRVAQSLGEMIISIASCPHRHISEQF
ncbi:NRPS [Lecanicillium sp. MT-2017a]|nr:NRPS [Lecanicillium sp. MT-2017a]